MEELSFTYELSEAAREKKEALVASLKKDARVLSFLKENGLEAYEIIADISARLIVNIDSMKLHKQEIEGLLFAIQKVLDQCGQGKVEA